MKIDDMYRIDFQLPTKLECVERVTEGNVKEYGIHKW